MKTQCLLAGLEQCFFVVDNQDEGRALARQAGDFDMSPHILHDAIADRQPEPRALAQFLGGENGVEYRIEVLCPDALAAIGHRDYYTVCAATRHQPQRVAVPHRLHRVVEQVDQHLLKLHLIAQHPQQAVGQVEDRLDAAIGQQPARKPHAMADALVGIERLRMPRRAPREVEQVLHYAHNPFGLLDADI